MDAISRFSPTASGFLEGATPFSLGPADGETGVLLVHGFTSTPYDLRACGEFLAGKGIASEGILLAGHGTTPEDLARTHLSDWLRTIRDGYTRLADRCETVFALGVSLSGNLLLTLAPFLDLRGLILVGTPLYFRHERAYRTAYRVLRLVGREYQKKWYLEHLDPSIRAQRPTYDHFPLRCAPDCLAAVRWSRVTLGKVRCPVLILQSTSDHAVDDQTIEEFRRILPGPSRLTIRLFENRYHVLLVDHGAEEAFEAIESFVNAHAPAPRDDFKGLRP